MSHQQETIDKLLRLNEELFKPNEGLLQRVEELEARIGRNLQKQNRPPSSGAPQQRAVSFRQPCVTAEVPADELGSP